MNFGSLFAGIGGIDLGLERAGMECAWQVEIDPFCLKVLEKHWPDVSKYGDVRDVGRHNLKPVDLIAGGFPCQPHSVAGKRKGARDDRNLWPEFSRIIAELKPRYVLAENVPGIISTYLDTVLSDLESQGYTCGTFNIPACAFDAPHRRERIFIVAHCLGMGWTEGTSERVRSEIKKPEGQKSKYFFEGISESGDVSNPSSLQRSKVKRYEQDGVLPEVLADTTSEGLERQESEREQRGQSGLSTECSWWAVEPNVGRVVHGVSSRVDRLRSLGNAVVPQVAEWIGERIMEYELS